MGTDQLYFIIGFLLGVMLMGSICVAACILWYEWYFAGTKKDDDE